jgi:ribose transport system ATP-binding protein
MSRDTRAPVSQHRPTDGTVALSISGLSKEFPGTRALDDVSFQVREGQIHGLLGGNGSGKSTLIKILAGVHQGEPGGTVHLGDAAVPAEATSAEAARAAGLRFVHQNASTFADMTVAENLALGSGFPTSLARVRWPALHRHAQALLDRFEIEARPTDLLGDLRQAEQTMVTIARALQDVSDGSSSVLLLDEPTASLPEHEVEVLLTTLRRYAANGQTILYISHRIEETLAITDSVTVLRDGRHVITRPTEGLTENKLIEHIVGRPFDDVFTPSHQRSTKETVLEVRRLRSGPLTDVSLDVRSGEIVGIAGLLGSGRSELLLALFGIEPCQAETFKIAGEEVRFTSADQAMARGVGLVPEDRAADAAFMDLSVCHNLSAAKIRRFARRGLMNNARERREAQRHIEEFGIRTAGGQALLSSLSGGNQQKVILARWLQREPRLLLLDEPTQGVDVGARADVHASVRRAVDRGMAALLVTSDFDELARASDRVLVLSNGRIAGELAGDGLTRDHIAKLVFTTKEGAL